MLFFFLCTEPSQSASNKTTLFFCSHAIESGHFLLIINLAKQPDRSGFNSEIWTHPSWQPPKESVFERSRDSTTNQLPSTCDQSRRRKVALKRRKRRQRGRNREATVSLTDAKETDAELSELGGICTVKRRTKEEPQMAQRDLPEWTT